MERVIAPSVLSLDFTDTANGLKALNESDAAWVHFDVMDGHFVPNISFGPDVLKAFDKASDLYMDVHLMVSDPETYAPVFAQSGADNITFHTECFDNDPEKVKEMIDKVHALGVDAGITVKPGTPIEPFESVLPFCDLVLVMSVEPGFGGQSFMEDQLEKVRWLDRQRNDNGYGYRIEIDGGINGDTWKKAVDAGVDTLVAGSYVFKGDIGENVRSLLQ